MNVKPHENINVKTMSGLQLLHRYTEIDREIFRLEQLKQHIRDEVSKLVDDAREAQEKASELVKYP